MPKLRLCIPEERHRDDPIPFPDVNRFARRDEARPADLRLSERIDAAFERVQRDLDALDDEIDRPFKLPGTDRDDDWPPPAA